jgi:predicted acetyltransferase
MYKSIPMEDPRSLSDLKTEHLNVLTAPLDAYLEEALIGFANHFEILVGGERAGYYCVNSDNELIAFYLTAAYLNQGEDILAQLIKEHGLVAALAGTNDPYFISLCLDKAKASKVHTLLFEENSKVNLELDGFEAISYQIAAEADFEDIVSHYINASGAIDTESVESGFEDLKGYVRSVMDEHNIFVLRESGELIATSECRISKTQKPHADVGMIVAAEQRRKGVGSFMLARAREFCFDNGVKAICSCEAGNIGSKKAIINAGFVSKNRIVRFEFEGL